MDPLILNEGASSLEARPPTGSLDETPLHMQSPPFQDISEVVTVRETDGGYSAPRPTIQVHEYQESTVEETGRPLETSEYSVPVPTHAKQSDYGTENVLETGMEVTSADIDTLDAIGAPKPEVDEINEGNVEFGKREGFGSISERDLESNNQYLGERSTVLNETRDLITESPEIQLITESADIQLITESAEIPIITESAEIQPNPHPSEYIHAQETPNEVSDPPEDTTPVFVHEGPEHSASDENASVEESVSVEYGSDGDVSFHESPARNGDEFEELSDLLGTVSTGVGPTPSEVKEWDGSMHSGFVTAPRLQTSDRLGPVYSLWTPWFLGSVIFILFFRKRWGKRIGRENCCCTEFLRSKKPRKFHADPSPKYDLSGLLGELKKVRHELVSIRGERDAADQELIEKSTQILHKLNRRISILDAQDSFLTS